jgi:hypothetical protein
MGNGLWLKERAKADGLAFIPRPKFLSISQLPLPNNYLAVVGSFLPQPNDRPIAFIGNTFQPPSPTFHFRLAR